MSFLLWPLLLAALEPRLVVTLPCTVGWIMPDARQVVAYRLYRHGYGQRFVTGESISQLDVTPFPGWAQWAQASCASFGLSPGLHAIAVSAVNAQGQESPRSPTLLLEVKLP